MKPRCRSVSVGGMEGSKHSSSTGADAATRPELDGELLRRSERRARVARLLDAERELRQRVERVLQVRRERRLRHRG